VKTLYFVANKLKRTFPQLSTAIKTLFRAYYMLTYACLWRKDAQSGTKRLQVAYNKTDCITSQGM